MLLRGVAQVYGQGPDEFYKEFSFVSSILLLAAQIF